MFRRQQALRPAHANGGWTRPRRTTDDGTRRPVANRGDGPLASIEYLCSPSTPAPAPADAAARAAAGDEATRPPAPVDEPAPSAFGLGFLLEAMNSEMTEAEAVAMLDRVAPVRPRLPTLATPDEIASARACLTIICPAFSEAFTRVFYGEAARGLGPV